MADLEAATHDLSKPTRKRKAASSASVQTQRSLSKKTKTKTATKSRVEAALDDATIQKHTIDSKPIKIAKAASTDTNAIRDGEKRLKRFKPKAPKSFADYHARAMSQRMFVIDRSRQAHLTSACQTEHISLAGTTGNIYNVTIDHVSRCTCPSYQKGTAPCKHIIYVLAKVLKAPSHLLYQAALLTSELREIFDNAGPLPEETLDANSTDGKRKPIQGDCPICCDEMSDNGEATVWCTAACGNNLHKTCFQQWAATKPGSVTCPYCRAPWAADANSLKDAVQTHKMGQDGYVNIASQLGISGARDYSSYHSYWVRREMLAGRLEGDYDYDYDYDDGM